MNTPGFTKFDCPSALLVRKSDHQAVALLKIHRRAGEIESLVHVKAERTANEKRSIENRVEPVALAVLRIIIAARIENGELEAQPILIDRELERGHLRVDLYAAAGDAVEIVFDRTPRKKRGSC